VTAVSIHESAHDDEVVGPSDRSFGLVFTAVFLIVALFPLWRRGDPRWWSIGVAATFFVLALAWPKALAPLNRLWLRIGLLMHRVMNPIIMGAVFYLVVTPFGVLMRRVRGEPAVRRQPDKTVSTYWIERSDASSPMDQQF
jgi:hypothetical protein